MGRFRIAIPYLLFAAMTALVVWSNLRGNPRTSGLELRASRSIDPVCHMEVNPGWGFECEHGEKVIYFCNDRCREKFASDPGAYTMERCVVCDAPTDPAKALPATYLGKRYRLDSEACRRRFKADPAAFFMHTMWGIPDWLYYLSIAIVLIVSFLMFEGASALRLRRGALSPRRSSRNGAASFGLTPLPAGCSSIRSNAPIATTGNRFSSAAVLGLPVVSGTPRPTPSRDVADRVDLLRWSLPRRFLLSRPARAFVQLVVAAMFLLIIAAGLFGNQNPSLNIAPLLTWTIWWCGLVVLIMFAGKAWCYMCPWDAIATWVESLRFWKKTETGNGLGLRWPRLLRNIWLATGLFVLLTWIEIGFGVTTRPAATAWLAVAMLVLAIVCALLFDRKSFCRYACLIGRVSGLYAMFAGIEVRRRDGAVCKACHTKECIRGSDEAHGCPTFEYPGRMDVNTYCTQCTECLQACPHDNMTVRLRPWGADLAAEGRPRKDEAYLALLMLAISSFHGLTMTPVWRRLTGLIESALGGDRIVSFTLGMAALLTAPILIYAVLVWLSYWRATRREPISKRKVSYGTFFVRYAYCVLPIALFYHLAHNLEHLLMEGPKVVTLISDPFGRGANLLGTAGWHIPPLVSLDGLWVLQVLLVGIGHVFSLWIARNISRRAFGGSPGASPSQWPMLAGMILFSIFSLWLLKQPMEMRTSAM